LITAHARVASRVITPQWVQEGGGVRLRRSIGGYALDALDPFLLFDHFESDEPDDFMVGFPLHPHRGIETVTYVLAGQITHRDTLGNVGTVEECGLEWMTAGAGILHEEMPRPRDGHMAGFQLWVNLPAAQKMTPPRYRNVAAGDVPKIGLPGGAQVRVLAGETAGTQGAVRDIIAGPTYLDVRLYAAGCFEHLLPAEHTAFAYVLSGEGTVGAGDQSDLTPRLVVLEDGDGVHAECDAQGLRFLLIAGAPLHEPIARHGPFVMNTRAEIEQALRDLREGTFAWSADADQADEQPKGRVGKGHGGG
jgi:quercetin 2,3-dioxygenase